MTPKKALSAPKAKNSPTRSERAARAVAQRHDDAHGLRVIRPRELMAKKGISKSRAYDISNERSRRFDPSFPKPVRLGSARATGWLEHEVDAWLQRQIDAHRGAA